MKTTPFTDPVEDVRINWQAGEALRIDACYIMAANDCNPAEVAERLGLDTDTINKMAHAGRMYSDLLVYDDDFAREVRDSLTYSHLSLVHRYVSAGVLLQEQAFEYLRLAMLEKLSTRKIDARIRVDCQLMMEMDFAQKIKKYRVSIERDLINVPYDGLRSRAAEDFAASNVRPAAAALLEALETLEGMIFKIKDR